MKINIDAGHGSNTAGKRTPPLPAAIKNGKVEIKEGEQYREHYANVGVASLLIRELRRCGFDVMKTGFNDSNATDDPDTALSDRQKTIAKANCDYSISIHFNAFGDGNSFNNAQGIGIYIHDKYAGQSEKFAQAVLKHLAGGTKQTNRGVSKQALAMCNCNAMDTKAAILVELAFMTNLNEAVTMMANEAYWLESAQEIARGVCEYTGIRYVPEQYIPAAPITKASSKEDIKWMQEKLKVPITGVFDQKTRIAVLSFADAQGWNWDNTSGFSVGQVCISRIAKL